MKKSVISLFLGVIGLLLPIGSIHAQSLVGSDGWTMQNPHSPCMMCSISFSDDSHFHLYAFDLSERESSNLVDANGVYEVVGKNLMFSFSDGNKLPTVLTWLSQNKMSITYPDGNREIYARTNCPDDMSLVNCLNKDTPVFIAPISVPVTKVPCACCYGTGVCHICNGTGKSYGPYSMNGEKVSCTSCGGSGLCKFCNGTGIIYK